MVGTQQEPFYQRIAMQKIVVDTNIIFSALLNTSGIFGDLLINSDNVFQFYTCYLLKDEISRHKQKLVQLAGFTENSFEIAQQAVFGKIKFISEEIIPFQFWQNALPIVRDVDMNDIAFVALADFINAPLWTGDKKLITGIRAKGYQNLISKEELILLRSLAQ